MTKTEKNKLIRELKNEIKRQIPIITESISCDTMTDEELYHFTCGVEAGLKTAMDILQEEIS